MKPYTYQNYIDKVDCYHVWRGEAVQVQPMVVSDVNRFDGGRKLTYQCANGYISSRNIEGSQLKPSIYSI